MLLHLQILVGRVSKQIVCGKHPEPGNTFVLHNASKRLFKLLCTTSYISDSDWNSLISDNATDAIRFNHEVKHLIGFAISYLIEFKDPKDELFYTEKHAEEIVVHSGSTEAVSA